MRFIRGVGRSANWGERTRKATAASVCLRCVCVRAFVHTVAGLEIPGSILATCRYYLMNGYPCITGCM